MFFNIIENNLFIQNHSNKSWHMLSLYVFFVNLKHLIIRIEECQYILHSAINSELQIIVEVKISGYINFVLI